MPNQKIDSKPWQRRKGATDARIAQLLAEVHQATESAFSAFFKRITKVLTEEEGQELFDVWAAGGSAPAPIWAKVSADPEAIALWDGASRPAWFLDNIAHNMIPSEHYVYSQTGGKMRGPNGEK